MKSILAILLSLSVQAVAATGPGPMLTYEGILTDATDTPITTAQTVTFEVLQSGSCVLYRETQTVTPGSVGQFSVIVGTGNRTDSTTNTLERIFAQSGTVNCEGSSPVAAGSSSSRSLRITVGATVLTPDVTITSVPYAIQAQRLGDKQASDFVNVNATTTQANVDSLFARYTTLDSILNIFPTAAPANGSILIGNGSVYQSGVLNAGTGINITSGAGSITISATGGGGTGTVTNVTALAPLNVTTPTTTPQISIPQASGTESGYLSTGDWNTFNNKLSGALPAGNIFVGDGSNKAMAVPLTGDASLATNGILTLNSVGTAGTYAKVTVDGKGRVTSGGGLIASDIPGLPWSQITSGTPTTLAGYGITDAVKNSGGTPSIQSGTDTGKPTAGTAGRLYVTTDTQKIYRDSGSSWELLSSGISTGATGTAGGDLSGTYPNPSVVKLQGRDIAATMPSNGQILKYNGTNWSPMALSFADVTGTLPVAQGGTGSASLPANRLLISNGTGAQVNGFSCTVGQLVSFDASGMATCANIGSTGAVVKDGNTFSAPLTIGTNDNYSLHFETAGLNRVTVTNAGHVGIGTSSPRTSLDVTRDGTSSIIGATTVSTDPDHYSAFYGYTARGTLATPTHPLSGQGIAAFFGANAINPVGYAGVSISATENHTATAQGMALDLVVTKNGTTTGSSGIRISNDGKVGIGTTIPGFRVQISDDASATPLGLTSANTTATGLRIYNSSGSNLSAWNIGQAGSTSTSTWGPLGTLSFKHDSLGTPVLSLLPSNGLSNPYMGGGVGINSTVFTGYSLYVNGNAGGTHTWTSSSDRRYKKDIHVLSAALEKILKLRGVSFVWDRASFPNKSFQAGQDIGVIAQEVEAVYPEAVTTGADGYKAVAYSKLVAPLIESTHELYGMCKAQESQIVALERKIASLEEAKVVNEERMQNLEKENAALKKDLEMIKQKLGL
ncbi:hypothetical protein AZI85_07905 [Bdellovibrio bacteriovorus]|uniref:Peptidase S74 domain-containing protein n=1 Tax=Bdellovibrio bacteriovorus TaxID=959 RepID=A0A150WGN9_BDEBC|nr:tail fiber domain-containing protein [Bdellovibrio bacteriovorus]KYG62113.1 hypothetical protein AZI85_07905 [Bdellovibrio bacteriovorus]